MKITIAIKETGEMFCPYPNLRLKRYKSLINFVKRECDNKISTRKMLDCFLKFGKYEDDKMLIVPIDYSGYSEEVK